jgi:hypothetical protein
MSRRGRGGLGRVLFLELLSKQFMNLSLAHSPSAISSCTWLKQITTISSARAVSSFAKIESTPFDTVLQTRVDAARQSGDLDPFVPVNDNQATWDRLMEGGTPRSYVVSCSHDSGYENFLCIGQHMN